jgi:hypothetical protein
MFNKVKDFFSSKNKIAPVATSTPITNSESETPVDYYNLINSNSVDELKIMHSKSLICTDCNNIDALRDLYLKTTDIEKFKFLTEELQVNCNPDIKLDMAIEDGHQPLVEYLVMVQNANHSRYATQMAIINKHYKSAFFAQTFGRERSSVGIDTVHRKHTKQGIVWSECVPEEYRFY